MMLPTQPPYDFRQGALLLIDKPAGWTSFDVVNKVRSRLRHYLGVKKIKVGHAGTLDPMATGLLLVATGKWTKKLQDLQGMDKTYTGTMTLGATTDSYDAETPVNATYPTDHITPQLLEATRQAFVGALEQLPPMYSAIKLDGQPLYKRARRGETIEVKPRPVTIHDFQVTRVELPTIDFVVDCSKGTYIRSLAYDVGKALGSGAYLSALCRTRIGDYMLDDAWMLDDLIEHIETLPPHLAEPI